MVITFASTGTEKDGVLNLSPNNFVRSVVAEKYVTLIQECLKQFFPDENIRCALSLGSITESYVDEDRASEVVTAPSEKAVDSGLNSEYTFENFIPGSSNEMARAAAFMVGDKLGVYNPLLIYGASGLGKSHLLHAVAIK